MSDQQNRGAVSLAPSTFVQGGLIDDVDIEITDTKFVMFDYDGKKDIEVPALAIEFKDSEEKSYLQHYSAGDKQYFVPSEDGTSLVKVGDKDHLQNSTNLAKFLEALLNAGFPEAKLGEGNIKCLIGLKAHVQRVAQPKRKGLLNQAGDDKEKQILVVTKIIALPGEKAATPTKAAGAKPVAGQPTTKATPVSAGSASSPKPNGAAAAVDVDGEATDLVMQVLGEATDNKVEKGKISQAVFKKIAKDNPNRNALTSRVFQDAFLSSGPWSYDGAVISLG